MPLIARYRRQKELIQDRKEEVRVKLEHIKRFRAEMKQLASDIRDKDAVYKRVLAEHNRLPKSINRQVYVRRIMDIKPPGSGESHRNDWTNLERLRAGDEVKFVITDRADFEWMQDVLRERSVRAPVLVSPSFHHLSPAELAQWILDSGLDVRLNLQMHKAIWGEAPGR